jgi:hypothetical protein
MPFAWPNLQARIHRKLVFLVSALFINMSVVTISLVFAAFRNSTLCTPENRSHAYLLVDALFEKVGLLMYDWSPVRGNFCVITELISLWGEKVVVSKYPFLDSNLKLRDQTFALPRVIFHPHFTHHYLLLFIIIIYWTLTDRDYK